MFEIETAAAFLLFSRQPADVTLLEVGLGGRLDATNVIETPLACAITPVSMDHLEFLGDTIEKIAAEKAAILKRNVPAAIAPQTDAVLAVIEDEARRVRAPLRVSRRALERAWRAWPSGLSGRRRPARSAAAEARRPPSDRKRRHRHRRACAPPDWRCRWRPSRAGIAKAEWPARMQRLTQGKLKALTPPESELWLDGGHNADGGRAVAAAIGDLEERVPRPLVLIVGMLSTKDSAGFLRNFAGIARRVIAVPVPRQDKSVPAETLVDMARRRRHSGREPRHARSGAGRGRRGSTLLPAPRILITGSLYLAGEVLAQNGTPPDVMQRGVLQKDNAAR